MADISKIKLPSGNEYDIKDAVAREMISGGISFIIVWTATDFASTTAPTAAKLATIPAGAEVAYNSGASTATGTLTASADTKAKFYLIYSKTQAGNVDNFNEYVTVENGSDYIWEKIGDTQIDLSNVVTDVDITASDKTTTTVIGSGATFTNTQPTITLATDSTSGAGKVQVATGISSVTQPTIVLSAESSSATGRQQYIQSVSTTKASANTSGTGVAWNSKDAKTVLTGVKVTADPTITVASGSTGDVTVATGINSATTRYLSAASSITGKTTNVATSVTPTTAKLAVTTITGVNGSTNITPVESRSSQTTATGGWTAVSPSNTDGNSNGNPDVNENLLANISVSNEVLSIGAASLNTQTTYSAGAPRASLAVPTAASNAITVATGKTTSSGAGADIVTNVVVGDTVAAVTSAPDITLTANTSTATGRITYVQAQGSATTTKLSASASGTAVGANGTASVIGGSSTFSVTDPTTTLSTGSTGDITVVTDGTSKYMAATASGTAVTPTQTYIKGTASGGGAAWNSKDQKTVLTNVDVTVTKGNA